MTPSEVLAANNAVLNGTSAVFLTLAVRAIRRGDRARHRKLVLIALACSAGFLTSYLIRVALFPSQPFAGHGAARVIYLTILISHMFLAMTLPPLVLSALWLSEFKHRYDTHRRVARVAFPVWMYVSVTGVLVYLMLYHWPR